MAIMQLIIQLKTEVKSHVLGVSVGILHYFRCMYSIFPHILISSSLNMIKFSIHFGLHHKQRIYITMLEYLIIKLKLKTIKLYRIKKNTYKYIRIKTSKYDKIIKLILKYYNKIIKNNNKNKNV